MTQIRIKSGLNEFQDFLRKKGILFQIKTQESVDTGIIIELAGITVGLASILLEFKKWLCDTNKKDKQIIVIINPNNTEININNCSEEYIKKVC